ncbi:MBL fold metallo-hydrolase [Massilia sp. Leaf139]|uniref:MBL fold metallo-hydrolase n=1 Tax=Massilia sp. Leaf139 TaxID=1736272 RepID=UPI0006FA0037|nr:MBL fold metallo-hydrolase [Massilia sp. Leaf139]KQQ87745.1 MBL fold metallo-hydrolase [Massilia sp. Leaf139]
MELQFLGTSSGTPSRARNVSGLALRASGSKHWYLVDCGEGTQHRILRTHYSPISLRAIFITHIHGDHCYGLPGLLASAGLLNRSEPLLIAGPPAVERFVRGVMESTELRLPYPVEFAAIEAGWTLESLPDFRVEATELSHRVPSFAFTLTEKSIERRLDTAKLERDGIASGPGWGQLQRGEDIDLPDCRVARSNDYVLPGRRPRKIIVAGDNDTPPLLAAQAQDAQVLVHEATYTEEVLQKVGPGPQHSSARATAAFAQGAGVPNLILTHFSPRYQQVGNGPSMADIEAEARAAYDGNLFLASDLQRYALDRHGALTLMLES